MDDQKLGIQYFNETWDLMDKADRTAAEDSLMIDMAHASSLYWRLSSAFTPVNAARSQWQLSRVYALLGMGESALYHAKGSLTLCKENSIGDFDLAFAYEAVARALAVLGKQEEAEGYRAQAEKAGEAVEKAEDRSYVLAEIQTIAMH